MWSTLPWLSGEKWHGVWYKYKNDIRIVTPLTTHHHTKIDKYLSITESAEGNFNKDVHYLKIYNHRIFPELTYITYSIPVSLYWLESH
jgi:hypothetical protein